MNSRIKITVDYYKPSGKWSTERDFEVYAPNKFNGKEMYETREKLEVLIRKESPSENYIGVVRYTEVVEDIIGFPMMVKKARKQK